MSVLLFEDEQVAQLHPATIGRPAFAVSCGSYRLIDLAPRLGGAVRTLVRPHLRPLEEADPGRAELAARSGRGQWLLINARLVPAVEIVDRLSGLLRTAKPGIVTCAESVAAALLPEGAQPPAVGQAAELTAWLKRQSLPALEADLPLLEYPHEIIRWHMQILRGNLQDRLARGNYRQTADGVFLAEGARLGQYVVTETASGPVVLDAGASIGPYCYLAGPAYIGPSARVIEHAAIKDAVSLGQTTKVGGEVEASIIEPYTNKQHHGFLGHSYLGSWINLGAGTCNSDLKNTYGPVKMDYNGRKIATDMQFLGCIMGDYAKTAINTGIFTGKTIGACSMIYGFVTTNVPSFVNYARSFGQVTETPVDVMIATQARMFARRNVAQRPCDIQLLRDMYELTRHERQIAGEPLIL